jgi:hypothetical protein
LLGLWKWRKQKTHFSAVSEAVVKDRERYCLLLALIVRREGEIICKPSAVGPTIFGSAI